MAGRQSRPQVHDDGVEAVVMLRLLFGLLRSGMQARGAKTVHGQWGGDVVVDLGHVVLIPRSGETFELKQIKIQ